MQKCNQCNASYTLMNSHANDYYDGRKVIIRQLKCPNNHYLEEKIYEETDTEKED